MRALSRRSTTLGEGDIKFGPDLSCFISLSFWCSIRSTFLENNEPCLNSFRVERPSLTLTLFFNFLQLARNSLAVSLIRYKYTLFDVPRGSVIYLVTGKNSQLQKSFSNYSVRCVFQKTEIQINFSTTSFVD